MSDARPREAEPSLTRCGGWIRRPGVGAHASKVDWSEEIAVDARGNIYMNDDKWGLFILRRLLEATDGKLFTLETVDRILDCTRGREFVTKGQA